MHDIITHKITTLTAKNEILRCAIYYLLSLFVSILPTGSDCPPRRLANFSAFTVCQSSRTKMGRITLLLEQGMAEGKRREGREGAPEGGREGREDLTPVFGSQHHCPAQKVPFELVMRNTLLAWLISWFQQVLYDNCLTADH